MKIVHKKVLNTKTALSAIAMVAIAAAGGAFAADLPGRTAPPPAYVPPPPVLTWNGFYAGLNIGSGWQDARSSNVWNPAWGWGNNNGGSGGVVGGGQLGYNFQFSPWLLVGLETDFQGTSIGSNGNNGWNNNWGWPGVGLCWGGAGWGGSVDTARINWFGHGARARRRYFPGNVKSSDLRYRRLCLWRRAAQFLVVEQQRRANRLDRRRRRRMDGGTELVQAEYLYTEISGNQQNFWWNPAWSLNNINNRIRFNTVRAGVNWHFNLFGGAAPISPAPVAAAF